MNDMRNQPYENAVSWIIKVDVYCIKLTNRYISTNLLNYGYGFLSQSAVFFRFGWYLSASFVSCDDNTPSG